MPLADASQQALIKASYKDAFYINVLRTQLGEISQQILGDNTWIKWREEIGVFADLCYFLLTTVRGSQTLGEEYACTIQVDSTKKKIPSKLRRIMQVLLQCTSPYFFEKLIKHVEAQVYAMHGLPSMGKRKLSYSLSFIRKLIPVVNQFHTILFYLEGVYMSISKRIAGVKHVLIRPYNESESDERTFQWLAILSCVQVLSNVYGLLTELKKDIKEADKVEKITPVQGYYEVKSTNKCILCLESIRQISSTNCGHMFCWSCIIEWCNVKSECPTCREPCLPSRIVRLHHYECL